MNIVGTTTFDEDDGDSDGITFSHDFTGSEGAIVIIFGFHDGPFDLAADGMHTALPLDLITLPNAQRVSVWWIPNPAGLGGSRSIASTWSEVAAWQRCVGMCITLADINGDAPYAKTVAGTGTGTSVTLNVPTASGEVVLMAVMAGAAITKVSTQTDAAAVGTSNRVKATTAETAAHEWSLGSSSDWAAFGVSLRPTGSAGSVPIPALSRWETRLESWASTYCSAIDAEWADYPEGESWAAAISTDAGGAPANYYDGVYTLEQTAQFRGVLEPYHTTSERLWTMLSDGYYIPNSYAAVQWKHFSDGPLALWRRTGNSSAYAALTGLRDTPTFSHNVNGLQDMAPEDGALQRECAYVIRAHLMAKRAGIADRVDGWYAQCIEWAYEHLEYDFVTLGWTGIQRQFAPFMSCGILPRALIEDWKTSQDARLIPALEIACDYTWEHGWHQPTRGIRYSLNAASTDGLSTVGSSDLNGLIAPTFAWLGLQTRSRRRMDQFDLLMSGSTIQNLSFPGGKQFNEAHVWMFEGIRWRQQFHEGTNGGGMRCRGS